MLSRQPFLLALPEPRPQAGIFPGFWAVALALLRVPGLSLAWMRCLLENPAPPDQRGCADPLTVGARGAQSALGWARGLRLFGGRAGLGSASAPGMWVPQPAGEIWLSPLWAAKPSGGSASFLHRSTHGGRKVPCGASSTLSGFEAERYWAPRALLAHSCTVPVADWVGHASLVGHRGGLVLCVGQAWGLAAGGRAWG